MIHSIDQLRAQHALKAIEDIQNKSYKSEYLAYVKALPATILQNGFGQAMAMELASGKDNAAHQTLFDHIGQWLMHETNPRKLYSTSSDNNLMENIITDNAENYIIAQSESLAYLEWLKKFAVAFLEDE